MIAAPTAGADNTQTLRRRALPHARTQDDFDQLVGSIDWTQWSLPTGDDLAGVPSYFAARPTPVGQSRVDARGLALADGLTFRLRIGLGGIAAEARDLVRDERTSQRGSDAARKDADQLAALLDDDDTLPDWLDEPLGRGTIKEWSPKSRARMVRTFASLDYQPLHEVGVDRGWTLGMITLTYPGRWWECAPTGQASKEHFWAFLKRFHREFGTPWIGLWKLEFQRRGAPHYHLGGLVPAVTKGGEKFEEWLSRVWAEIVAAPDPAERARHEAAGTAVDFAAAATVFQDAKRIGVYFAKHGTKTVDDKEYQHVVPEQWQQAGAGPGRFWGYRTLTKPEVLVELTIGDWIRARRILRKVLAGRDRQIAFDRARWQARELGATDAQATRHAISRRRRTRRTLGAGGQLTGGFVLVNDSLGLALDLARWLDTQPVHDDAPPDLFHPDYSRSLLRRPAVSAAPEPRLF